MENHLGFGPTDDAESDDSAIESHPVRRPDNHPYRDPRHGLMARRRRLDKELRVLERAAERAVRVRQSLGVIDAQLAAHDLRSAAPRVWSALDALPLALRAASVMGTGAVAGMLVVLMIPRIPFETLAENRAASVDSDIPIARAAPPPAAAPAPVPPAAAPARAPGAAERAPLPMRDLEAIFDNHVERLDRDTWEVERGYVQEVLNTGGSLRSGARIIAHEEHGRVVGVRIYGVRLDGIAGRLGLRNGDMLMAINGLDMASPDSAMQAYEQLHQADVLALLIERRGQRMILVYRLVDQLTRDVLAQARR